MKEYKGTKGEWSLQSETPKKGKYPADELIIDFSVGHISCVSVFCSRFSNYEEDLANAKLIAAAPELLEALQEIVEVFDRDDNTTAEALRIGKAQKVINKALK